MNQRTVVITLALICLMAVVGLVGLRGWAGPEKTSNPPGCFDIEVHPVAARLTFVVNRCTGETWQLQEGSDGASLGCHSEDTPPNCLICSRTWEMND